MSRTVDLQLGVADDLLDASLLLEGGEGLAGEGSVDLETIDEGSDRDQAVRLDILLELVIGGLVEDDGVLGLVLDCWVCQWRSIRCRPSASESRACVRFMKELNLLVGETVQYSGSLKVQSESAGDASVTYPCPWTTSSSASCRRLLRVPAIY